MASAAVALANDPYSSPEKDKTLPWIAILYAVVFVAGIGLVASKNAKRTHLD